MWKVGLIGTGYWSDNHIGAWNRIPNAQVTALANRSQEKLLRKAQQYGLSEEQCYGSIDVMLEQADIDIVDIVTGPETHLELVTKAAKAGKHIMCQKPFAQSLAEAEQMVQTAADCGVRLMVTENWRWLQPFQRIKQVLQQGRLGKLHVARYVHTDYYTMRMAPETSIPQPYFRDIPQLLFYEMGVHWFDTWRFLFGMPNRLYAEVTTVSPYIKGEDSGIVVLGYDDFYGFLDMSWATRQKLDFPLQDNVAALHLEQMVIDGAEATLKMYTNGKITIVSKDGKSEEVIEASTELDHSESHFRLQSHFIHCLDSGEPFQTSGEDNVETLRLTFGVYESASTHRPVYYR